MRATIPCPECGQDRSLVIRRPSDRKRLATRRCLECAAAPRIIRGPVDVPCPYCGRMRTILYDGPSRELETMDRACKECCYEGQRLIARARTMELYEEIQHLGCGPELTAKRLGTTVGAIARRLQRAGLHEAARPYEQAKGRQYRERPAA